jgi:outer membrane protein assembly factor BamB
MKQKALIFGLAWCLQACTPIDDFMLGKDNTPAPTPLSTIQSKLKVKEKWSVPLNPAGKTSSYLKLKPTVRGDVIYLATANGKVQAVNKKSGQVLWSKDVGQGILSGPTVAEGFIALGLTRSSLLILRQDNAQEVLRIKLSSDALSKPVIAHHKVLVKTIDGYLYAFDLKNGEKLWATEHGSPSLILKASSSPVRMGDLLLVGFSDGKLDGVDIQSGRIMWQRSIAYATGASDVERLVDIDADPIVRGERVYLASYQGYIGALSLSDGQFIWRKPASIYKNMAIDNSNLYVTDNDDVLWAFDRVTGQVKWKQLSLKARGLTEPVLLGNHVVVGDKTGYLHVLSRQNGEILARMPLKSPIDIAPAVSGNDLYIMTVNGQLTRLAVS